MPEYNVGDEVTVTTPFLWFMIGTVVDRVKIEGRYHYLVEMINEDIDYFDAYALDKLPKMCYN